MLTFSLSHALLIHLSCNSLLEVLPKIVQLPPILPVQLKMKYLSPGSLAQNRATAPILPVQLKMKYLN